MIEPRERVPYDGITGLAYCFATPVEMLDRRSPKNGLHHGNQGKEHLRRMGELGLGILHSRVQLTRNIDHNADYNKDPATATRQLSYHPTFKRSKVPRSEIGGVRVVIFGAARAVTQKVLDFEHGTVRPIRDDERQRLFYSGELGVQSMESVGRVLTQFTIQKGINDLTRIQTSKYKDLKPGDAKKSFIDEWMEAIVPVAFEPIEERYAEASHAGLLPNDVPDTASGMAGQIVMHHPGRFKAFDDAFIELTITREAA